MNIIGWGALVVQNVYQYFILGHPLVLPKVDPVNPISNSSGFTGTPLIRPLWWTAPDDQAALTIDSEFLVGTNLLVAPILDNGKRHRDIYLPNGRWKDNLTGETVEGGKWLKNYNIELKDIATFTRLTV